jgi:VIT1/CCC1 family predicted Fe2+/Mn2+ transporter
MKHSREIEELEARINEDERTYVASVHVEEKIIEGSPSHQGFAAAYQRVRLLGEMQALAERLRRSRIMLAWARN